MSSNRVRVYDLARELGLTNKELIALLGEAGLEVKSHASSIDEEFADLIRDQIISKKKEDLEAEEEILNDIDAEEIDADDEDDEDDDEGFNDKEIHLKPPIIVRDLADALKIKPNELIAQLMMLGVFANLNQKLEVDSVEKVCEQQGFKFFPHRRKKVSKNRAKAAVAARKKDLGRSVGRAPVIACIGHVDHGKTSLLDYMRHTHVTKRESGGITQHIGASVIEHNGKKITFLDTPGHEAFVSMRARGANMTDIIILVVAADDGVMPQTIEAIKHAKAAGVPIIVAMNKIDLPAANPDKVLVGLQQHELMTEDWGGEIGCIRVSAITGEGVEDLLDRILLEAEMLELKGNPDAPCEATVIEAQIETGIGATASVLIRNGIIHVGDIALCGGTYGRVKALINEQGDRVKSASVSEPIKVVGLSEVPEAGETLVLVNSDREAKRIANERAHEKRQTDLAFARETSTEDIFQVLEDEKKDELKIIIRADVRGSLEAIRESLAKISSDKIRLNIVQCGIGEIKDNDITMAETADAIIIGFHVRVMPRVSKLAKSKGVEIRLYSVIYELLESIEDTLRGRLEPEIRENPLGAAEIKQIFHINKIGKVCGCFVSEGLIRVGASARVTRDGEIIYSGLVKNLKRFQDEVKEVKNSLECGIALDNFEDFEVGDKIEVITIEKFAAKL